MRLQYKHKDNDSIKPWEVLIVMSSNADCNGLVVLCRAIQGRGFHSCIAYESVVDHIMPCMTRGQLIQFA